MAYTSITSSSPAEGITLQRYSGTTDAAFPELEGRGQGRGYRAEIDNLHFQQQRQEDELNSRSFTIYSCKGLVILGYQ